MPKPIKKKKEDVEITSEVTETEVELEVSETTGTHPIGYDSSLPDNKQRGFR